MDIVQLARECKALGDPNRLRILQVLYERDRTIQGLIPYLGIKQPSIWTHLNHLKEVGFVREYRQGKSTWYSYDHPKCGTLIHILNQHANNTAAVVQGAHSPCLKAALHARGVGTMKEES